jgi:hypothetical protein
MRPFTQPNIEALIADAVKHRAPVARVERRETELAEMTDKLVQELCSETLEIVAPKSLRDTLAAALRQKAWLSTARHMDCYVRIMELRETTLAAQRIAKCMGDTTPPAPPVAVTASPAAQKAPRKAAKPAESDEARTARLQALYDNEQSRVSGVCASGDSA